MIKDFKKICLIAVTFVSTVLLAVGVSALENTNPYEVPELFMTVDVPTSINVVTRGTKQGDTLYQEGVFDYVDTMTLFREQDIYLLAKNSNADYSIFVTMTEDDISKSYDNLKDSSANQKNQLLDILSSSEYTSACIAHETGNAFYYATSTQYVFQGQSVFNKEYYTIVNSQNIKFTISSQGDPLTDEELALILSIVDSARYSVPEKFTLSVGAMAAICIVLILLLVVAAVAAKIYTSPQKNEYIEKLKGWFSKLTQSFSVSEDGLLSEEPYEEQESENKEMLDFFMTDGDVEKSNSEQTDVSLSNVLEIFDEAEITENKIVEENQKSDIKDKTEIEPAQIDVVLNGVFEEDKISESENEDTDVNKIESYSSVYPVDEGDKREDVIGMELTEGEDEFDPMSIDVSSFNAEDAQKNQVEESSLPPVDLAAAIANFEDDYEARELRRQKAREEKEKSKNSRSFFGLIKKK